MRKTVFLAIVMLLMCAAALLPADGGKTEPVVVKIGNFSFGPEQVTIKAGTTVTWLNEDDVPHNVVSTARLFKSEVLDTDERFSYTFREPGTYKYFCALHPHMTGRVIVQ